MNAVKKLLVLMLVLAAVLSLAACGSGEPGKEPDGTSSAPIQTQSGESTEPEPSEAPEQHVHTWTDATCTEPRTCAICGATEGEALGHLMLPATTEAPATCSRCGFTEGEPLAKYMDWNLLILVYRNVKGTYRDEDGQEKTVDYTMPDEELKLYEKCAKAMERDLADMSGGVIVPHVTFKVAEATLPTAFLKDDGDGFGAYLDTKEAESLLRREIDLNAYDHVTIIADLDDMPCGYWGLTLARFSQETGYAFINNYNYETFSGYFFDEENYWTAGPVIHEFLHFMEGWSEKRGKPIGYNKNGDTIVDSGETLGYKPDDYYDFKAFYTDIINCTVTLPDGTADGIDPAMWREPPHLYR